MYKLFLTICLLSFVHTNHAELLELLKKHGKDIIPPRATTPIIPYVKHISTDQSPPSQPTILSRDLETSNLDNEPSISSTVSITNSITDSSDDLVNSLTVITDNLSNNYTDDPTDGSTSDFDSITNYTNDNTKGSSTNISSKSSTDSSFFIAGYLITSGLTDKPSSSSVSSIIDSSTDIRDQSSTNNNISSSTSGLSPNHQTGVMELLYGIRNIKPFESKPIEMLLSQEYGLCDENDDQKINLAIDIVSCALRANLDSLTEYLLSDYVLEQFYDLYEKSVNIYADPRNGFGAYKRGLKSSLAGIALYGSEIDHGRDYTQTKSCLAARAMRRKKLN